MQGRLFLASEFVPGETLRATIGGRPSIPRRAIEFAAQIADALAEAHVAGHRPRRPPARQRDGHAQREREGPRYGAAVWTEGGAARARAGLATTTTALQDGVVARTAPYMSPEQALGEAVDYRTDIFSLGVVLFEMLTGRVPFRRPRRRR